jgi:hypothetical protein
MNMLGAPKYTVNSGKKFSRLGALEHIKDVKVHTTYFLPVEASTKA